MNKQLTPLNEFIKLSENKKKYAHEKKGSLKAHGYYGCITHIIININMLIRQQNQERFSSDNMFLVKFATFLQTLNKQKKTLMIKFWIIYNYHKKFNVFSFFEIRPK